MSFLPTKLKITEIYKSLPLENPRADLLVNMRSLENSGKGCQGCSGVCCTFEKNSMKVSPVEAVMLAMDLIEKDRFNEELMEQVQEIIRYNRLDQDVGDGSRFFVRRNYTCPFFSNSELGCQISPDKKPYGCLAFNRLGEEKEGGSCESQVSLLEQVESHNTKNEQIKSIFGLTWENAYIPIAIRDLLLANFENR